MVHMASNGIVESIVEGEDPVVISEPKVIEIEKWTLKEVGEDGARDGVI